MKILQHLFIRRILISLGFLKELTAQETLEMFIKEQKHINRLERIKAIRSNSNYEPDYNKPKLYQDINIINEDGTPISDKTVEISRPIDFGHNIRAWKKAVRLANKEDEKRKRIQEENRAELHNLIHNIFGKTIMRKMTEVN